ncbi:MAG: AAA family ATPase [archaeon]
MSNAKVVGVMSFKGGVGKTTCTANIAASIAAMEKKVLAVDSNFSSPNLALNFGLINPENTLSEVLSGEIHVRQAIHTHYSGVNILPSPQRYSRMDLSSFKKNIDLLRKAYDYILLDCSPTINDELMIPLSACDSVILVSTPDYPTLLSTMLAAELVKEKEIPIHGLILNRKKGKKYEINEAEIEEATGVKVIGTLPEDSKVLEASYKLMPISVYAKNSPISREFKKIAAKLMNVSYKEIGFLDKLGSFIFRQ